MGCNRHYYVYKDGHCLSDYDDYDQALKYKELVDGEITTEKIEQDGISNS